MEKNTFINKITEALNNSLQMYKGTLMVYTNRFNTVSSKENLINVKKCKEIINNLELSLLMIERGIYSYKDSYIDLQNFKDKDNHILLDIYYDCTVNMLEKVYIDVSGLNLSL